MNVAQATFLAVTMGLSAVGTVKLYPEVAKHAASERQSLVAAFAASTLFGTFFGLVAGALVNVLTQLAI